jgi:hypothetical protein
MTRSELVQVIAILLLFGLLIWVVGSHGPDSGPQPPYSEIADSR